MARKLFRIKATRQRPGPLAAGVAYVAYTDTAATVPADISATLGGSALAGSEFTLDSLGGATIYGPTDDTTNLYLRCPADAGLGIQEITADADARLDVLEGGGGSGIAATLFDAKGDLIAATAADTAARLAVGSRGQLLVADPTPAAGLKWSTGTFRPEDHGDIATSNTTRTAAIQAAVDAAIAADGVVELTQMYTINAPIVIDAASDDGERINMVGRGWTTGLTLANGVNDYAIKFLSADNSHYVSGGRFAHFLLDANGTNQTAGGCINAKGAVHTSFERLHFTHAYDVGLLLDAQGGGGFGHHNKVSWCLFDNAQGIAGPGQGVRITSSDENWFIGCDFEFLGGTATPQQMIRDLAGLNYYLGCNFVNGQNNCKGIVFQDCSRSRVIGCVFDGVNGDNVYVTGSLHLVEANTFSFIGSGGTQSGGASGVVVDFAAKDNIVSGNLFEGSDVASKTRSFIRETGAGGGGNNVFTGNAFRVDGALAQTPIEVGGTGSIVRANRGYVTEAKGTSAVASGGTSIAVTHGLARTPVVQDILLTLTNNPTNNVRHWVSAVSSTTFTVTTSADPGASGLSFAWQAQVL